MPAIVMPANALLILSLTMLAVFLLARPLSHLALGRHHRPLVD